MLAIDIREDAKTVTAFSQKMGIPFPVLLDSTGSVANTYGIRGIPAHFIIDQEGKILGAATGPRGWDSNESLKLFRSLIDKNTEKNNKNKPIPKTKSSGGINKSPDPG